MSNMNCSIKQEFARAIGHTLQKVVASIYFFEEKMFNDSLMCLWLYFENLSVLHVFGSPDGWHIQVDNMLPEPIDMGESGEIVIRDISRKSIFQQMLGRTLQAVWTVDSPSERDIIGIRLDFGLPVKPLVLNWGDELHITTEYPHDAEAEELLEVPIWIGR